ncbi:MAG: polysaccharide deacetylase family protein [Parasporobacterium sp.]|nr:polysaccharide deacetylase family protein [Parasporobacterium sp.]
MSTTDGVRIFWDSQPSADGYFIYSKTGNTIPYHFVADIPNGEKQVSWMDSQASENQYSYYWVVPYYYTSSWTKVMGNVSNYVYGIKKKRAVIRSLTTLELNAIQAAYSGAPQGFSALPHIPGQYNPYALEINARLARFGARFFGDTGSNTIYLTFPSGWENAPNTSYLLDVMAAEGVKAVFYVTHEYASHNPDLIRRIIREGHEIGNHSYAHPADGIPFMPLAEQMNDALRMQEYMQNNFGYTMRKYNFESSVYSDQSVALMTQMGYEVCFYSFNYSDYDITKPVDPGTVYNMLMAALAPGVVYYLHTVSSGNTQALPAFIRDAKARGYQFAPLP